jgi:hypothetical protein
MRSHQPTGRELLHVWAKCDLVKSVFWKVPGEQAEVKLAQLPTTFLVSLLKKVTEEEQEEEIRPGDMALLMGKYMVLAAPDANDAQMPCIMQYVLHALNILTLANLLQIMAGDQGGFRTRASSWSQFEAVGGPTSPCILVVGEPPTYLCLWTWRTMATD